MMAIGRDQKISRETPWIIQKNSTLASTFSHATSPHPTVKSNDAIQSKTSENTGKRF